MKIRELLDEAASMNPAIPVTLRLRSGLVVEGIVATLGEELDGDMVCLSTNYDQTESGYGYRIDPDAPPLWVRIDQLDTFRYSD